MQANTQSLRKSERDRSERTSVGVPLPMQVFFRSLEHAAEVGLPDDDVRAHARGNRDGLFRLDAQRRWRLRRTCMKIMGAIGTCACRGRRDASDVQNRSTPPEKNVAERFEAAPRWPRRASRRCRCATGAATTLKDVADPRQQSPARGETGAPIWSASPTRIAGRSIAAANTSGALPMNSASRSYSTTARVARHPLPLKPRRDTNRRPGRNGCSDSHNETHPASWPSVAPRLRQSRIAPVARGDTRLGSAHVATAVATQSLI